MCHRQSQRDRDPDIARLAAHHVDHLVAAETGGTKPGIGGASRQQNTGEGDPAQQQRSP